MLIVPNLIALTEAGCVVPQVVFDEGRDEVVAMVVALVTPQYQRLCDGFTRLLQQVRMQLLNQKFIGHPLVDQDALGE